MSYLVLARKWRPKTFADTVGQEHVLKALVNALESGRLHHAYLFTGTRGVGKTTIARILAKALNCEQGVTAEPCGECSACLEIDEGRFVDLIEVDAASKTKVDDTRELLDNVQYSPARGRYKVYLIDEVHMLSKSSFNALLKTLEEPPPHVKFLLATTDPQKLPVTVLSRCLQFNLSRLTPKLMADRLASICDAENVSAETGALNAIARSADGSMRDALSLLDQAIAYCGGTVDAESVAIMLGTIDRDHVVRLIDLLASGDAAVLLRAVADIDGQYPDYGRLLEDIARYLQRIAIHQVIGATDYDDEYDSNVLADLADRISPADVQLFYQTAILGKRDIHLAPDPRSGAEMSLLRMLAFRPAGSGDSAPAAAGGDSRTSSSSASSSITSHTAPAKTGKRTISAKVAPATAAIASPTKWTDPDWSQLIDMLELKGAVRMLAINCAYLKRTGNTLYFSADAKADAILTRQRKDALAEALSQHYSESLLVDIVLHANDALADRETPVQQESRKTDERYKAARESLEVDPNVQALKKMFGAELKSETIEPIER
ncbi:MAG TPA: DNA polymerase III subunit gamma/tau [Woeseiaceae bacterium]|nr:DNA polymerase III subunit gamma/tau [Woeseiaceae bacterium]